MKTKASVYSIFVISLLLLLCLLNLDSANSQVINGNTKIKPYKELNKWGYKDTKGVIIVKPKYDNAYDICEGFAVIELNGKYGYINNIGNEITPIAYDDAYDFCKDFAVVKLNDKYGYINKSGKEITSIIYDNAFDFKDDYGIVKKGDKEFGIDKNGKSFDLIRAFVSSEGYDESDSTTHKESVDNKYFEVESPPICLNLKEVKTSMKYPKEAKLKEIQGKVTIKLLVDVNGDVINIGGYSGNEIFYSEVATNALNLKFTPAFQKGQPTKCWVSVPFNFSLNLKTKKKPDVDSF